MSVCHSDTRMNILIYLAHRVPALGHQDRTTKRQTPTADIQNTTRRKARDDDGRPPLGTRARRIRDILPHLRPAAAHSILEVIPA